MLEIVSNTEGHEDGAKKQKYAHMRIRYYVIYDPLRQIMPEVLTVYRLRDLAYERQETTQFPSLNLGLMLWDGTFESKPDTWLRWTDERGGLILTGKERAEQEHQRAEQAHVRAEHERQRAEHERQRAEQERQRAERLAALLRQAGIDPEQT